MSALVMIRCAAAIIAAAVVSRMRFAVICRLIAARPTATGSERVLSSGLKNSPLSTRNPEPGTRNHYDRAAFIARWLTPMYSAMHLSPKCLEKAVALHLALRWCGIHSDVILGANLEDGTLRAHAWVVAGGDEFFRSADCDYEPVAVVA